VEQLELAETVEALRAELARAAAAGAGAGAGFQFPVAGVQLEFHVGGTKVGEGETGVRFYVVELGGSGSYAREEIQTVTVTLGAPVDQHGDPVKIYRGSAQKP
jgi:Trypsin-co-occurring domain 2